LVRPFVSAELRARVVSFCIAAWSSIAMFTVRMSPIWAARWSLKKARAPGRQSEFGWCVIACWRGIGSTTG
jgi:hypothetical protein